MSSHNEYDGATTEGHVVVGFDGSPAAWKALRWAADEAGRRRTALEVVWCAAGPAAGRELDQAARVAGYRGVQVRIHRTLVGGSPGEVLVDRSRGAAALVLGRHDDGPPPEPGRESLSAYCHSNAACPVTVVDSTSHPDHPFGRVPVAGARH